MGAAFHSPGQERCGLAVCAPGSPFPSPFPLPQLPSLLSKDSLALLWQSPLQWTLLGRGPVLEWFRLHTEAGNLKYDSCCAEEEGIQLLLFFFYKDFFFL